MKKEKRDGTNSFSNELKMAKYYGCYEGCLQTSSKQPGDFEHFFFQKMIEELAVADKVRKTEDDYGRRVHSK